MSHFQESHYHSYNVFQELLLAVSLAQGGVSLSSMMLAAMEPSPSLLTALILELVYTTVGTLRMLEWFVQVRSHHLSAEVNYSRSAFDVACDYTYTCVFLVLDKYYCYCAITLTVLCCYLC